MPASVQEAIACFGKSAKAKLSNPTASGEPEDQLRAPFERLLSDMAEIAGLPSNKVVAVGESSIAHAHTRPDYAVTVHGSLSGFVELKAPGKGADPRKFKTLHDKAQWIKLQSLPNLLYSDGNEFSLWRDGALVGKLVKLDGDIEVSGAELQSGPGLENLFGDFLAWQPIPPSSAKELAHVSARLCRLLREEVAEELQRKGPALSGLAADWRKLLFPEASDRQFADGYAQAVTFGLLMARARGINVGTDLHAVAEALKKSSTLIGAALQLLTDNADTRSALATSLGTLERVLEFVDWQKLSKGNSDAWLYFYEEFLEVYDNDLRKKTGSYYTPPEVVNGMVRLVDEALRSDGFGLTMGLVSPSVTIADPATGTGTYVLGVLRHIAAAVMADEGPGALKGAIDAALARIIAFEVQLGPYAVAQLRVVAEAVALAGEPPKDPLRMFVTDTLSNPNEEEEWIPHLFEPIAKQRKDANQVKRAVPITVVIGNPPYKEKAKGRGGWVEGQTKAQEKTALLRDWMPPANWGVGAHAKHLRNLYVYFWRWATWKVFEQHPASDSGIVCFITVAGFLNGPGFERMRQDLRLRCDAIWVIDCSPEGHQPPVSSRIFQGVQQPVCIVLAARWSGGTKKTVAAVNWRSMPRGHRQDKFAALATMSLSDASWQACPTQERAPFLPAAVGAWANHPLLDQFFLYDGAGVMPGRTWIVAPDAGSLRNRWRALVGAPAIEREQLFHPHLRKGKPGDKHANKVVASPLARFPVTGKTIAQESGDPVEPIRYGYRTFDRQWIIPDARLINQPNPRLWEIRSDKQVFITALGSKSPTSGPALTVTGLIPDLDHYKGSFGGRVFPLWLDADASVSNIRPALLLYLSGLYARHVQAAEVFAYIVSLTTSPEYVALFRSDLALPGLRIPLTADEGLFTEAVSLGRRVIWLHSFGEREVDANNGRPGGPPRLPNGRRPQIPAEGSIPSTEAGMPDRLEYDEKRQRLIVGAGWIEPVSKRQWDYEVSGKQVLIQWFSYRRQTRERPIIGDRRQPSALGDIQPKGWPAEYSSELLNVLNVLGLLVDLEPQQKNLLERVCDSSLVTLDKLRDAEALEGSAPVATSSDASQQTLFGESN